MQSPYAASPLDAWRGGRNNPTQQEIEDAYSNYVATIKGWQPPKTCPCHPAPTTRATRRNKKKGARVTRKKERLGVGG